MKNILLMLCFIFITYSQLQAQDSTKEKMKTMIDARHYVFEPNNMITSRGRSRYLTPGYFFRVNGDTLTVYLPYVGRAYSAPVDPSDAGYDFTTTDFTYAVSEGKKKSYNVSVKTKGKVYNTDFTLTVYDNGTAYLSASGSDKDPVSYNGDIKEKK
jgi:uncharacterized protein DUF4251